jgi:hypothetical protein
MSSNDEWMLAPGLVDCKILNIHLKSTPELIEKGGKVDSWGMVDFYGNARPQATGFDTGAEEFPAPLIGQLTSRTSSSFLSNAFAKEPLPPAFIEPEGARLFHQEATSLGKAFQHPSRDFIPFRNAS